ncbi:HD-GYP domain-containing protein [Pleomorphomonas sp. PLEO]|uniref:HD-GYP domain-containing protein n=1 Tax=Pleomorphomonas sp. PLEO TaxID=3239306 RepID=UPI00351E304C
MGRSRVKIRLLGEPREEADTCLRGLLSQGFAADRKSLLPHDIATVAKSDILVVTGQFRPDFHTPANLSRLLGARRERTILFLSNVNPQYYTAFEQAGFLFINVTTDETVRSLAGLIAEVDPHVVYDASKTAAMRASMSDKIAHEVVDLFNRLRADPAAPKLEESKRQQRVMSELIGKSPMSVWIELIQNYHDGTAQHCSLVSGYTLAFARVLGAGEAQTGRLFDAAFFHDVGKAMIPLEILDKTGPLDAAEWEIMKRHVIYSYDILSRDAHTSGEIARVARDHHEYLDGSGYPNGIAAGQIDDITRIITICDIFAALTEKRAYKPPKPFDEAYSILLSMAGTKLDPDLVRLFGKVAEESSGRGWSVASAA